jgi:catenin alpha
MLFFCFFKLNIKGDEMAGLSKEFADDPCSKSKREQMIIAARALLSSVTRLLILADHVDVKLILKSIRLVCRFFSLLFISSW